MATENSVGQTKRTLFATWRVESCERGEVSFPFGSGFGCGQTSKISQGYKQSLQTQVKSTVGSGLKLAGAIEVTASSSVEESVTIGYEFTSTQEWSFTAPQCEYCTPDIVFPDSVVTVWAKRPFHVPFFVSKVTTFEPGPRSEIRGNCRKDPKRCNGCSEVVDGAPGASPILSLPHPEITCQIHHVVLAERRPAAGAKDLLDGMEVSAADQLFFVGLDRTLVSATRDVVLLSIDDIDRALGIVRLNERGNHLLFLVPESESGASEPKFTIRDDDWSHGFESEFVDLPRLAALGVRLLDVYVEPAPGRQESGTATISLQVGKMIHEWPITIFPSQPSVGVRATDGMIGQRQESAKAAGSYQVIEKTRDSLT